MRCRPRGAVGNLFILFFFLGACFVTPAFAQLETATVSGQLVDPSGLSLGGAHVKLVDIDRDSSTIAISNNSGVYTFASVHPGRYRMEVDAAGFKKINVTGLTLNVQDHIEQNFHLQIGSVAESVTVEANVLQVNTTDATVSTVVDRQFAENLPMNGRSFQTLIDLTPGVVATPSTSGDSGQFSVNGQRAASNYWMVDGVSANIGVSSSNTLGNGIGGTLGSFSVAGGTNSLVSVDALQEFRIQTSTYAPEFGRTPGGQISIITRSGTNQYHGTAFDYLRNDTLDANNWFNGVNLLNPTLLPKAKERQNDFGGTFSGPIFKDRTFFFFSYEGLRLQLPQTMLTTVPDTSSLDPFSRQFATPAMQPYLGAFPLPNGPEVLDSQGNHQGIAQFNSSFSNPATLDAYSLRVDQKIHDKWTLFARYNYSPSDLESRGAAVSLNNVFYSTITTQTATIGATGIVSSTITNDLRFNYSRTNGKSNSSLDTFGGAVPITALPFPSSFKTDNAVFGFSVISLTNGTLNAGVSANNIQRQTNIVDSLSWQSGSHSFKFGGDFRRLSPLVSPPLYTQVVAFLDMPSAQTGNSLFGATQSQTQVALLFKNLGAYAQDTWRTTRSLTITYGLRWDIDASPSSLNGPSIPAVAGYNLIDFSHLTIAPAGTPAFKTTYGNVAPRLGVAYQLSQSRDWATVIRGGFGVFYDLVSSETGNLLTSFYPPFGAFGFPSGAFPFAPSQVEPPSIPTTGSISELYGFNPHLKLPYTLEWNVALEQALSRNQLLSLSYIGASGTRLLQSFVVSGPSSNPNVFGSFIDNTASSAYDALQIQYQRRLSHGLESLVSYSWSHSIDDGSASSTSNVSNLGVPGNLNANRGPSDFDIRNSVSAGLTYDVRIPKLNKFSNAILRGWSTQNLVVVRSAPPVDITDSHFLFFKGGIEAAVRPDLITGHPLYLSGSQFPGGKAFNPGAFSDPPVDTSTGDPLRQGTTPRNFLRGFAAAQWDSAVHRDFPIHDAIKLQFRAEFFNVLNHPNFAPQSGTFGVGGFGISSALLGQYLSGNNVGGGAFSPLYQLGGPRSIQLALKVSF
jgi:carboxypeptidase family protein